MVKFYERDVFLCVRKLQVIFRVRILFKINDGTHHVKVFTHVKKYI